MRHAKIARFPQLAGRIPNFTGAEAAEQRVMLHELARFDLIVISCVAVGEDGARLGKGGGFANLEYAKAAS